MKPELAAAYAKRHQLVEFLQSRLAKYKIPKEFVFRETLPRTPYGKDNPALQQKATDLVDRKRQRKHTVDGLSG